MRALSQVTAVDFDWPKRFWKSLSEQDQKNLIRCVDVVINPVESSPNVCSSNVVGHMSAAKSESVKQRQVALFALVDPALGQAIAQGVNVSVPSLPNFPVGPTWLNTTVQSGSSTLHY